MIETRLDLHKVAFFEDGLINKTILIFVLPYSNKHHSRFDKETIPLIFVEMLGAFESGHIFDSMEFKDSICMDQFGLTPDFSGFCRHSSLPRSISTGSPF